jgi:MFS family permease
VSSSPIPTRRRWLAFAAILAAGVMDLLDASVANIAAPSIRTDLGGTFADLEWITVGYTLAMAVTLLVGARLGDMLGRRRLLLGGMAGFAVRSGAPPPRHPRSSWPRASCRGRSARSCSRRSSA